MKLVCKLLGFILNLWVAVVEGVGFALKTVGTVLVDTVDGIVSGVADAIGLPKILTYGLLGYAGFLLLTKNQDRKSAERIAMAQARQQ